MGKMKMVKSVKAALKPKLEIELKGKELKWALALNKKQAWWTALTEGYGFGIFAALIAVRRVSLQNKLWGKLRKNHPEMKGINGFSMRTGYEDITVTEI
jgi:hypothetical protein